MRILNIFLIILFVSSALLQYNDPDPFLWMPIYLSGALICFMALLNKFKPLLYIIALSIYIPFAVYLFFYDGAIMIWLNENKPQDIIQSMKATKPWIEQTREFLGLIILIMALIINWIWFKRKQVKQEQKFYSVNPAIRSNVNS